MLKFSSKEKSNLLTNRFRLEKPYSSKDFAEAFQNFSPSLRYVKLNELEEKIRWSNPKCFRLQGYDYIGVRGAVLDLSFYFDFWKKNYSFGAVGDKFIFPEESLLAYRLKPREFWDVLIRADKQLGTLLKDSCEFMGYKQLPKEISLNTKLRGGSIDSFMIKNLKNSLSSYKRENISLYDIACLCLDSYGVPKPDEGKLKQITEELARENGLKKLNGEPLIVVPKQALDYFSMQSISKFLLSSKNRQQKTASSGYVINRSDASDRKQAIYDYEKIRNFIQKKDDVSPLSDLENDFEYYLIRDLLAFKMSHPNYTKAITISSGTRSKEEQAALLMKKWKDGSLSKTYTQQKLYPLMELQQPYSAETTNKALGIAKNNTELLEAVRSFFNEPNDTNVRKIFLLTASSDHMNNRAVDISGNNVFHSYEMKRDLVEFLHKKKRYTILLYKRNTAVYTSKGGFYTIYKKNEKFSADKVFTDLQQDIGWFFHVQ